MDSPAVQSYPDPVVRSEAPKSRDVDPGRKRDDRDETREAAASTAALTVSFAELLQSKRLELKAGADERSMKESAAKTKQAGQAGKDDPLRMAKGKFAAGKKQPVAEVQVQETLDHARELAGAAMKAATEKRIGGDNPEALQSTESAKKGGLTSVEEVLLKEMTRNNGNLTVQKKAAQVTGFVNGEPLTRREGIGAVKAMTAKEGEVIKNLSGEEEARAPQKLKTGKSAKAPHAFAMRDTPESEEKAAQAALSTDKSKQEFAGLADNLQDKLSAAGSMKKQGTTGGTSPEIRDVSVGAGTISTSPGRAMENPVPVRPQAVVSQILDGATQILRNGSGRVVLTLQPAQLGKLDLDVAVQDNRVKMVLLADNQEVKQMLQAGMEDLRNALQDKGFQIDRLEILVQNRPDESGSNFWQEAGFARDGSPEREQRKREPEAMNAVQGSRERTVRAGESGISIFA